MTPINRYIHRSLALSLGLSAIISGSAVADRLLTGTITDSQTAADKAQSLSFSLSGESRDDVIGGEIAVGGDRFEIVKVSPYGMIAGNRSGQQDDKPFAEFAIFSSSFSQQTAVGQPWVVSQRYLHCDQPYNSFLAVYRVQGDVDEVTAKLGDPPYSTLTKRLDSSDRSVVYCFISRPPA